MSTFKFENITCEDQQEEGRGQTDEIYFILNDLGGSNQTYISNVMEKLSEADTAQYHTVHPSEVYNFRDALSIQIWEFDPDYTGQYNPDELLFDVTVYYDGSGGNEDFTVINYAHPNAIYTFDSIFR